MDIEYPYATGQARRQLLYRLPSVPAPRRLLVIGDAEEAEMIGAGWGASVCHLSADRLAEASAVDQGRFDAVALGRSSCPMSKLLDAAWHRLEPGGAVMGHVAGRSFVLRPSALRKALSHAGFDEPTCYYLQPGIDAPMVLAPTTGKAARAHAIRAIHGTRGLYSQPSYALRLAAAWLGLDRWRQSELFFWGRRPC
jgi:hypothetical protein